MLHGVSGARFSYFTFPRLGSYFLMPCQLWHVQQYSLVAFVSVIVSSFRIYHSNIRANGIRAAKGASRALPPLKISHPAQNMNSRYLNHWIAAEVARTAVAIHNLSLACGTIPQTTEV